MDIKTLSERALEIRAKYVELEKKRDGKEWSNIDLGKGFIKDVTDLMEIIKAKEGLAAIENVDEKLAHELSDCLWSVFVLASKYSVDLEQAFMKTMDELEMRIDSQK